MPQRSAERERREERWGRGARGEGEARRVAGEHAHLVWGRVSLRSCSQVSLSRRTSSFLRPCIDLPRKVKASLSAGTSIPSMSASVSPLFRLSFSTLGGWINFTVDPKKPDLSRDLDDAGTASRGHAEPPRIASGVDARSVARSVAQGLVDHGFALPLRSRETLCRRVSRSCAHRQCSRRRLGPSLTFGARQ